MGEADLKELELEIRTRESEWQRNLRHRKSLKDEVLDELKVLKISKVVMKGQKLVKTTLKKIWSRLIAICFKMTLLFALAQPSNQVSRDSSDI